MSSTDPGAVALIVSDRDLADVAVALGATYLSIEAIAGVNGGVTDDLATIALPGRLGQLVVSSRASAKAGQVSCRMRVKSASLATTALLLDQLASWCRGTVSLRSSLAPLREARGRVVEVAKVIDQPYNATGTLTVTFSLDTPLWYDKLPQAFALTASIGGVGTRVAMPQGSGPTNPMLTIYGASTSPITINYRDQRGLIVSTLTLNVSLAATDFLTIDTSARTIVKTASGVAGTTAAGVALRAIGSRYPVFDPDDADRYGSGSPTLEIIDAGNTATALVTYSKAWK